MKMLQTANSTYISQTRRLFYCDVRVKIPAHQDEAILNHAFTLLEHIDQTYNSYTPGSIFSTINSNAGHWVTIDQNTAIMLQSIAVISQVTNGAYDVTLMPLLKLWGFYKNGAAAVPTAQQIEQGLERVDYTKVQLKGNQAMIGRGQEIVTGSFIKAFAVDVLAKQLVQEGVTNAVINAGGSTIYSVNESGTNRNVNLPHPFKTGEKLGSIAIAIANACFSLSATMTGHIVIDGKKYGHIINAKTGYPSANVQCGVICKSAFLSDVLSTALFAVHEDEFETVTAALKTHFDFEAYLVTQQGAVKSTAYPPFKALKL